MLATLQNLFTLAFVVTSMLAMGLSLSLSQILQPLRNARLVIMALVANFVVVPAAAFALTRIIPLQEEVQIGLLLMGTAAGAPFLPKIAQIAKANVAFAVGLMAMLMVITIFYLPLVLPLLLPGVEVDAVQIALSLCVTMLAPLLIGLFIKARYEGGAQALQPVMAQISTISLALLFVLLLAVNFRNVLALFGTGAILATLLFVALTLLGGYLLGGPTTDTKRVMALGTGTRNLSAAFIIATANFADQPNVLVFLAAAGLGGMVVTFPTAGEFGKRSETATGSETATRSAETTVST
ncbi:MAG TPA: bile acid:sodium symporter [Chloroflexia bacterium]|nr:bile acid:sodium symporter [Chloroflexia bacterium]